MTNDMSPDGKERCDTCRAKMEDHARVFVGSSTTEKRYICPQIRRAFGDA